MHLRTRADLERRIDAARQLRAETLGGAMWIVAGLVSAFLLLRRSLRSKGPGSAHRA